jgi:hypothetical protein
MRSSITALALLLALIAGCDETSEPTELTEPFNIEDPIYIENPDAIPPSTDGFTDAPAPYEPGE